MFGLEPNFNMAQESSAMGAPQLHVPELLDLAFLALINWWVVNHHATHVKMVIQCHFQVYLEDHHMKCMQFGTDPLGKGRILQWAPAPYKYSTLLP